MQLFFLVSAVTMAMMWDARAGEPAPVGAFYARRFFRIAPMYWLALLAYQASARLLGETGSDAHAIALNLLFLHALSPHAINSAVPGGWSIGVEMLFYAVFPWLVARGMGPLRMLWIAFAGYVVLGLGLTWVALEMLAVPALAVYYSPLTQFPIFPLGIALYTLAVRGERLPVRPALAIVACWLALAAFGKWGLGIESRPLFWCQVFALAGLTWWLVQRRRRVRLLAWLGSLSYSMYLLHFGVIDFVRWCWPDGWAGGPAAYLAGLAVCTALTAALAHLSRGTLEQGSTRAGARAAGWWQRRQAGSPRAA